MPPRTTSFLGGLGGLAALALATAATAAEIEIGEPMEINGMAVGAVYLQAVVMAPPEGAGARPDIHLEADVHALEGNPWGLEGGAWVPYLDIAYRIEKAGAEWSTVGSFVPMVANDGPHYGDNVALDGPGTYTLTFAVGPPVRNGLYRHTDRETGVPEWWAPFQATWTFAYVGTGKKGGY